MEQPSVSSLRSIQADQASVDSTRLHGRWLLLARMLWLGVVGLSLGLFVTAIALYSPQLSSPGTAVRALLHPGPSANWYIAFDSNYTLVISNYFTLAIVLSSLSSVFWIAIGLLIFWRKSDDWIALFVALTLITHGITFSPQLYAMYVFSEIHSPWRWLVTLANILGWGSLGLFLYLFPNGRFVPRWMGLLALCSLAYQVPVSVPSSSPFSNEQWPPLLQALVLLSFFIAPICAQLYRYRHPSSPVEQQQTKWVVFGIVLTLLADVVLYWPLFFPSLAQLGLSRSFYALINEVLSPIVFNLIPLTIGIAVLRYRLWDIDILINRTLVYGVLTVSIVTFYALVVVGLGMLLQAQSNPGIALLATGLVAVLFHPLRTWLQRLVNRLMYGERDDPYRVLSRLGQRLEATLAPEAVLPTIVETVAQALKLPYVAITLKQGDAFMPAATYGTSLGELFHLPLIYQTEQVGELILAPRTPGESFTSADRKLLADLAHQAGVAAHAVRLADDLKQLTIDLQHSRERLVTAREEERRRLRRDLHDGLGPQLAGLTLKLETARNRLAHDALADTLLSDLTTRTQAAVSDIRRLVYALRPPALDELGLVPALREQALQYSDHRDNGLHIRIAAPDSLPELPAAMEVAVYRIAQEALTNVVRHAHARHCDIRLALDEPEGRLTLEVRDDGGGLTLPPKQGVGLTSMRERADELGGAWTIKQVATGGTCVLVHLPFRLPTLAGAIERQSRPQPQEEND